DEEKAIEKKRHMGDTKHFCPVILKENFILCPGSYDNGAKYRDKYYYFSTPENRDKFLENPEVYVSHNEPLKVPPLRVCLLGSHGSGKTICARWLANKLGIFHIQFEERLQELIMLKTGVRVGPETEEDDEEETAAMQEMGGSPASIPENATEMDITSEEGKQSPERKELQLTDEEEAIKANLIENEALPPEVLDGIVSEWWTKEPFRSTGFILDGFPRTADEAMYLAERGLCPDIVVYLEVEEDDISDRILPKLLQKWQEKQNQKKEKKQQMKEQKAKMREDLILKRRTELLAMQAKRKQNAPARLESEVPDEDEDDEEDDIEAVLEEEFPKEEDEVEEEEEEQESEAIERLKLEIAEKFETDLINIQTVQEEFDKISIPQVTIGSKRKPRIVCYQLYKKLKDLVEDRESLFEKCYPISVSLARKMIALSYKHPSNFGEWDPIKLSEGEAIKSYQSPDTPTFPVIHRNSIYFFVSKENRDKFMKNPIKYIRQPKPKPTMPVKIAIVGPPKSGKTTVAKKFASVYGLKRLSMGDAIRMILNDQPDTELALMLKWHLHKGLTAPDELAIQALDIALMDTVCNTAGFVIDGYPVTRKQVNILEYMKIIPVKMFEMQIDAKEVFRRAVLDKQSPDRPPYPIHDSSQILAIKNSCYKTQIEEIRAYYEEQHQNWYVIDASHSKWWNWDKVLQETQMITKQIQLYLERIRQEPEASKPPVSVEEYKNIEDFKGEVKTDSELKVIRGKPEFEIDVFDTDMQNREEERPSEFKAEILQLPFVTVTSNKPVPEETTAEVTVQVKIENEESEIALQLPASKQTSSDISIVSSEENKLSQNTCLLESASEKLEHASAADISIATQVDGTLTVEAKRVEIAEVFNVHLPNPKGGKTFSEILIPCQTTEPLIPKKRAVLQNLKELPEATPTELRQLTKVKLLDKQGEDTLQELFIFLRDVTHRLVIDKHFGDFAKLADWYKVPEYETVIQQPMDLSATVSKIDLICSKALEHNPDRKAASIADLCITPQELLSRLGEFGQYCPVSLAEKGELVDCSVTPSLRFAAEFRGHYYKMAGQEELDKFLKTPELYVPPLAPHPLPLPSRLPKKLTAAEVKALFPMQAEMQGYCPVTYLEGKQRLPEKYWKQTLPHKLPPKKEPVLLTALPLTGYLEQGVATALIKAMNEVGCLKPKFPFLSVKKTALLFIAYHLKAFNPRSSDYVRKKYKRKLDRFIDNCELIPYLGTKMTKKYKEPQNRPIDFDHKLQTFLSLKGVDPATL
ncbi:UNVERIFIED_CONTAM: hypothetical protein K2H54_069233, partial [Gekko kuhli]